MTADRSFRPRLSLPTTVIAAGDVVYLVAGEDVRYTVRAGSSAVQFADLLRQCDGRTDVVDLLRERPDREQLRQYIQRLASERILVDGPVEYAAIAADYSPVIEGSEPWHDRFSSMPANGKSIALLCQDDLNYETAFEFNRRCLRAGTEPWMWITTGPVSRGYVSPIFLPHAGPCLACLLRHFQRLSPLPQLYDALARHGQQGGRFAAAEFPVDGLIVLERVARWKIAQLRRQPPSPAVFRLHVLELETMEVQMHRVLADPTCPECADARLV